MGEMQRSLERLLTRVGVVSHKRQPAPRWSDIEKAEQACAVDAVYRKLGGALPCVALATQGLRYLRSWDMEFNDVAVELDESLHFNRYRAATLESRAYERLRRFPLDIYRSYCSEFEPECLRAGSYGGKWSNKSCEHQFGVASVPPNLNGSGAPRWKQRALYDFVKDLSPLLFSIRVARIAVWDRISDGALKRSVADILLRPTDASGEGFARLIQRRTVCSP